MKHGTQSGTETQSLCYDGGMMCDRCGTKENVNVKMSLQSVIDGEGWTGGWTDRFDLCSQCTSVLLDQWLNAE